VLLQTALLLSSAGSQMTAIAYPLLVLGLTGSPTKAGVVALPPSRGSSRRQDYDEHVPEVSSSTLELLHWIGREPRSYSETMDAWTTHCPRLTVWEDALVAGLVEVRRDDGAESQVVLTGAGTSALRGAPA
jgi:hypothetical protein